VVALCLSLIQEMVAKKALRAAKGKEEIIELDVVVINKRRTNIHEPEENEGQAIDAGDDVTKQFVYM